jgi:membrane-associated phospholipid phosphatase
MPESEVEQAAQFLATHAVLLLGLGLVAAVVALLAIVVVVRTVGRYRSVLLRPVGALVRRARRIEMFNQLALRASVLIPNAYLALHLSLGLLLVIAAMVFGVLAEQVLAGGEMTRFDVAFAGALREHRSPAWERFFVAVSWCGSRQLLSVATLVVAAGLFFGRSLVLAVAWVAAQAGGGLLNVALKETFERTRPEFADSVLATSSWSFPSGHAMGTFIFCGLGCYLVIRERRSWSASVVAISTAIGWSVVMAFSRLYLGVHFASDVLAGIVGGAAWVAVCSSALEVLRRQRV